MARTNLASSLLQQGKISQSSGHYRAMLTSDGSTFLEVACHAGLLASERARQAGQSERSKQASDWAEELRARL